MPDIKISDVKTSDVKIVIKRYKKPHHVHHGGAWKIAYADFVTAMMAFFLLMWLINVATEETKKGIAEYFTTSVISLQDAGAGTGIIEGEISSTQSGNNNDELVDQNDDEYISYNSNTPKIKDQHIPEIQVFPDKFAASEMGDKDTNHRVTTYTNESDKKNVEHRIKKDGAIPEEANVANIKKIDNKDHGKGISETKDLQIESEQKSNKNSAKKDISKTTEEQGIADRIKFDDEKTQEKEILEKTKQIKVLKDLEVSIKKALNSMQLIKEFNHNLIIELTEEGVKIQIVDSPDHEMFKSGSSVPVKFTEKIIQTLADVIRNLPNKIDITGHTDSIPYHKKGYGNWELSADRANATRRILEASNVARDRFSQVNGRADKDPINKNNPKAPENRRISITVLYDELQKQQQEDTENNSVDSKETKAKFPQKPQKRLDSKDAQPSRNPNQNNL